MIISKIMKIMILISEVIYSSNTILKELLLIFFTNERILYKEIFILIFKNLKYSNKNDINYFLLGIFD